MSYFRCVCGRVCQSRSRELCNHQETHRCDSRSRPCESHHTRFGIYEVCANPAVVYHPLLPLFAVVSVKGTYHVSFSNGRTGGIASPNWSAQAAAIRTAYANAGILSLNDTAYLECHGTGTPAGDYAEVKGAGAVFAPDRPVDKPLIIGSVCSP